MTGFMTLMTFTFADAQFWHIIVSLSGKGQLLLYIHADFMRHNWAEQNYAGECVCVCVWGGGGGGGGGVLFFPSLNWDWQLTVLFISITIFPKRGIVYILKRVALTDTHTHPTPTHPNLMWLVLRNADHHGMGSGQSVTDGHWHDMTADR